MNKIARIIKAKTSSKKNMPDWYYDRLEQCIGCEHNSGNVDKISTTDRLRIAHNFGKDACLLCTCGVEDKSSDEFEQCPKDPPKWLSIFPLQKNLLKISLNEDSDLYSIKFNKKEGVYMFDYGELLVGQDSSTKLFIDTKGKTLEGLSTKSSCGCTTVTNLKTESGYVLSLKYETSAKRVGRINKQITIRYKNEKGETLITVVKIKGSLKHRR